MCWQIRLTLQNYYFYLSLPNQKIIIGTEKWIRKNTNLLIINYLMLFQRLKKVVIKEDIMIFIFQNICTNQEKLVTLQPINKFCES